jgi:hypothetical protein
MCNVSKLELTNFEYRPVLPGTYIFSEINIASWKHDESFGHFAYEFNSINEEGKR